MRAVTIRLANYLMEKGRTPRQNDHRRYGWFCCFPLVFWKHRRKPFPPSSCRTRDSKANADYICCSVFRANRRESRYFGVSSYLWHIFAIWISAEMSARNRCAFDHESFVRVDSTTNLSLSQAKPSKVLSCENQSGACLSLIIDKGRSHLASHLSLETESRIWREAWSRL